MTRWRTGFAGVDRHGDVAAAARLRRVPSGSSSPSTRCRASARRSRSSCARSASRRSATCSCAGRAATSAAADEVAISELWGDEEVAIAGVVADVQLRRLARRADDPDARVADATRLDLRRPGSTSRGSRSGSQPGTRVRLRGQLGRYGFDVKSYDLGEARATADFAPVYPASEQVPSTRLRELVARGARRRTPATCSTRCRPSSRLPLRRDALAALHFPARRARRPSAARQRLALDELLRSSSRSPRRARREDAVARRRSASRASSSRATGRRCRSS